MDEGISVDDFSLELPEILDGERLYSKHGYLEMMEISKLDNVKEFEDFLEFFLDYVELEIQQVLLSARKGIFFLIWMENVYEPRQKSFTRFRGLLSPVLFRMTKLDDMDTTRAKMVQKMTADNTFHCSGREGGCDVKCVIHGCLHIVSRF